MTAFIGVVTIISLAKPAAPAGVTAVIEFALTTLKLVTAVPPTVTLVVPVKLVPLIVIDVPPATGPYCGLTPVIVANIVSV